MSDTKILLHIHSSTSSGTYDLEVSDFDELMREISEKEMANEDTIEVKLNNKVLDNKWDFASLDNAHIDVMISMIGPGK